MYSKLFHYVLFTKIFIKIYPLKIQFTYILKNFRGVCFQNVERYASLTDEILWANGKLVFQY